MDKERWDQLDSPGSSLAYRVADHGANRTNGTAKLKGYIGNQDSELGGSQANEGMEPRVIRANQIVGSGGVHANKASETAQPSENGDQREVVKCEALGGVEIVRVKIEECSSEWLEPLEEEGEDDDVVRPHTRQALRKHSSSFNGHIQVKKPQNRICARCGDLFPYLRTGGDEVLCPSCKPEKRSPPSIVFRKGWTTGPSRESGRGMPLKHTEVGVDQWVLGKSGLKREESSRTPQVPVKEKRSPAPSNKPLSRKSRSRSCMQCAACLRSDCGLCKYCKDKPKYGGKGKMKQKCLMRRCKTMHLSYLKGSMWDTEDQQSGHSTKLTRPVQNRSRTRSRKHIRYRYSSEDTTEEEEDEEGENSTWSGDEEWTPGRKMREDEKEDAVTSKRKKNAVVPMMQLASYVLVNPQTGQVYQTLAPATQGQGSHNFLQVNGHAIPPSNLGGPSLPTHLSVASSGVYPAADVPPLTLIQPKEENTDYQCWPPPTFNQPREEHGQSWNYGNISSTLNQPSEIYRPISVAEGPTLVQPKEEPTPVECVEANGAVDIEVDLDFGSPARPRSPYSPGSRDVVGTEIDSEVPPEEDHQDSDVIPQPYYLAEEREVVNMLDGKERALLRFLRVLRRTVLPAHWVCVMAAGPLLQLLQCSKLSTMGDTVLQIEPGFSYQLTVQRRHLLPTHTLYDAHPPCFANTSQVVSLLLELEGMAVCQGFENRPPQSLSEPVLLVRAATCLLLVPQSQERCEHCRETLSLSDPGMD